MRTTTSDIITSDDITSDDTAAGTTTTRPTTGSTPGSTRSCTADAGSGTSTARRAVALLALHATGLVGAVGVPSSALAAGDAASGTLEALCLAHGGSFHVNTYDGVNLICSAPRHLGDFAAERAACDRFAGEFSRTTVIEGRASWFCHDRA